MTLLLTHLIRDCGKNKSLSSHFSLTISPHFFALMSSQSQQLHAITIRDFHIFSFYLTHHKDFFSFYYNLLTISLSFSAFIHYLAFLLHAFNNKSIAGCWYQDD